MSHYIKCDIAIIGAGAGGLSVAAVAAQLGLHVILVESGKMGGECLNAGCVPSKSLIATSKIVSQLSNAQLFGVEASISTIDFNKVMSRVHEVITRLEPNDSIERFTSLGVDVVLGKAIFTSPKIVAVGEKKIQARRFIIATGSLPIIPPIPGLEKINYLTNENLFQLNEKPEHLIIIGGGPIGCEIAQAFLQLNIPVTLLEAFTIMPRDEPDLVAILKEKLLTQKLTLHERVRILEVNSINQNIHVSYENNGIKSDIEGSHLLIATGRRPNIDHLNLEKANVAFTNKAITVDAYLRTSNKKIYAIGDVVGPYQFTHMANYHAGLVIRNAIFKGWAKADYHAIPWVTYTSPELAHTGITTAEAKKMNIAYKEITIDLAENDRAQIEGHAIGKIKIIVTKKGKILGASILAAQAGELIVPWIMLIQQNKTLRDLTNTIIPYPTLSEISKKAANEFYKPMLFSKTLRFLVSVLKYF